MKILIALPAFNEAKVIGSVLKTIPKSINGHKSKILVIDDGSTDKTSEISRSKADIILRHSINQGVGSALITAFLYAKRNKFDLLVTFDADGQHQAKDISRLIKPILDGKADVVNGSRLMGRGYMPQSRKLINYIANIATFMISGLLSSDSQSGLRAFNKKAINSLELKTRGMEISSEILYQTRLNNLKYKEIPIEAIYTKYSMMKGQKLINAPNVFFKLIYRLIRL